MRINSTKLKRLATERQVTVDQLAEALPGAGRGHKSSRRAATSVRNWLAGRDHPRCRAVDIAAMAQVVGAEPKELAKFSSTCRYARMSGRKVGLVAALIRGRSVDEADSLLEFSPKRAAVFVRKALNAAAADAQAADADPGRLVVTESRVECGPTLKRFRPKDRGRAHPIKKRTSHIVIAVEEVG